MRMDAVVQCLKVGVVECSAPTKDVSDRQWGNMGACGAGCWLRGRQRV